MPLLDARERKIHAPSSTDTVRVGIGNQRREEGRPDTSAREGAGPSPARKAGLGMNRPIS